MARPDGQRWIGDQRRRIEELIDEQRQALDGSLEGLSDGEARRRLVPSKTTLLGLVKHATFVEGVWFDQAITGRSPTEIGIPATVDASFTLRRGDTIDTVRAAYRQRWHVSRANLAGRRSDEIVEGRGARPIWTLQLQVLASSPSTRATPTSCGEQVLASRPSSSASPP